jgi:hypothetical protein
MVKFNMSLSKYYSIFSKACEIKIKKNILSNFGQLDICAKAASGGKFALSLEQVLAGSLGLGHGKRRALLK